MTCRRACSLLAVLLCAGAAAAQVDLTGTWDLTAQMTLTVEEDPMEPALACDYVGTGEMTQVGNDVTGPISLTQTTSVMDCPATLTGDFSGTIAGTALQGTITSGKELSQVSGVVTDGTPAAPLPAAAALMIQNGMLNVTAGPFDGTAGTFVAAVQAPMTPVAGPVMLIALALILLVGGSLLVSRRIRPA